LIKVESITKKFGDYTALENFSLTIHEGHIYGIVGYNGAGKTTLMKTIAGIYRPERGSITMDDVEIYENERIKGTFFMVQDEPLFFPQATLTSMEGFYKGYYPGWNDSVFKKLIELFGLNPKGRINGFSKGMQRQASIILGLATMPQYLLLDESFDGLDLAKRNLLKALLFAYLKANATNILISSHNLKELEGICDHIAIIKDKELSFGDSVEHMRQERRKFHVILPDEHEKQEFYKMGFKNVEGSYKTYTFISKTTEEETRTVLQPLSPTSFQSIALTLEEIFLDEMEEFEYDFNGFFS